MQNQNLPIPVGAHYAQRKRIRPFHLRRWGLYTILATLGLACATVGAYLSTLPPTYNASLTSQAFSVAGYRLAMISPGQYQSQYGALVVQSQDGVVQSAGSTTINGVDVVGHCAYTQSASQAHCNFTIGSRTLTSQDTLTASGWDRHYSDGTHIVINWPKPTFAVPFPLGV